MAEKFAILGFLGFKEIGNNAHVKIWTNSTSVGDTKIVKAFYVYWCWVRIENSDVDDGDKKGWQVFV